MASTPRVKGLSLVCKCAFKDYRATGLFEPIEIIDWIRAYWRKRSAALRTGCAAGCAQRILDSAEGIFLMPKDEWTSRC